MVLYPEEGISDIQKLQMTSAAGQNVSVIGGEPWIRCLFNIEFSVIYSDSLRLNSPYCLFTQV